MKLKQAETTNESLGKLRDALTRIMNVLDVIRKSSELIDVLILLHQKPTVKRWFADEDVELDALVRITETKNLHYTM